MSLASFAVICAVADVVHISNVEKEPKLSCSVHVIFNVQDSSYFSLLLLMMLMLLLMLMAMMLLLMLFWHGVGFIICVTLYIHCIMKPSMTGDPFDGVPIYLENKRWYQFCWCCSHQWCSSPWGSFHVTTTSDATDSVLLLKSVVYKWLNQATYNH